MLKYLLPLLLTGCSTVSNTIFVVQTAKQVQDPISAQYSLPGGVYMTWIANTINKLNKPAPQPNIWIEDDENNLLK